MDKTVIFTVELKSAVKPEKVDLEEMTKQLAEMLKVCYFPNNQEVKVKFSWISS